MCNILQVTTLIHILSLVSLFPGSKSEIEAKSFLMRALAPVTNFFKNKPHDCDEKVNWIEPNAICNNDNKQSPPKMTTNIPIPAKIIIHRVESAEHPWWLDSDNQDSTVSEQNVQQSNLAPQVEHMVESSPKILKMKHVESGEGPWWLDENAEIPEGVETYPNWVREDGTTADGLVIFKLRKNDSDESSWWVTSSEKTNTDSGKERPTNVMDEEYLEKHKIRHIDSGERAWWLNSSENIAENVSTIISKIYFYYQYLYIFLI